MPGWMLPALDLVSLVAGLIGTIFLARAVGTPPGMFGGDIVGPTGRYLNAYVIPKRFRLGIRFIVGAFLFQLPKAVIGLIHALAH
jgi:hypothetical protein